MTVSANELALELKTQALANARRNGSEGVVLDALEGASFPQRKTERWKYTSLQALADGHLNGVAAGDIAQPLPALSECVVSITNGALTGSTLPDGVSLHHESPEVNGLETPFALYNSAVARPVVLEVAANTRVAQPIHQYGFLT